MWCCLVAATSSLWVPLASLSQSLHPWAKPVHQCWAFQGLASLSQSTSGLASLSQSLHQCLHPWSPLSLSLTTSVLSTSSACILEPSGLASLSQSTSVLASFASFQLEPKYISACIIEPKHFRACILWAWAKVHQCLHPSFLSQSISSACILEPEHFKCLHPWARAHQVLASPWAMVDPLQVTQVIAAVMLAKGGQSLKDLFQPMFSLQRWQQAPVGSIMAEYVYLMSLLVEVLTTAKFVQKWVWGVRCPHLRPKMCFFWGVRCPHLRPKMCGAI